MPNVPESPWSRKPSPRRAHTKTIPTHEPKRARQTRRAYPETIQNLTVPSVRLLLSHGAANGDERSSAEKHPTICSVRHTKTTTKFRRSPDLGVHNSRFYRIHPASAGQPVDARSQTRAPTDNQREDHNSEGVRRHGCRTIRESSPTIGCFFFFVPPSCRGRNVTSRKGSSSYVQQHSDVSPPAAGRRAALRSTSVVFFVCHLSAPLVLKNGRVRR